MSAQALDAAIARLLQAGPGDRNNTLYRETRDLSKIEARGGLPSDWIARVTAAASRIGQSDREIRATIFSARKWRRDQILRTLTESQDGLCALCDAPLGRDTHLDHVIPRATFWNIDLPRAVQELMEHDAANLQAAHARCNEEKSDRCPVYIKPELSAAIRKVDGDRSAIDGALATLFAAMPRWPREGWVVRDKPLSPAGRAAG